ncbi:MAG: Hpt domain-containing protein [Bdellovibrionales bacterium]|nr:Hpt domain-containing protein [Bdellovibrionales bacterium]
MSEKVFNLADAKDRVDGDKEFYEELAAMFLDTFDDSYGALKKACENLDSKALTELSHSLKGSLANLGAERASAVSFSLERMGRSGNFEGLNQIIETLFDEVGKFKLEVEDLKSRADW